MLYEILLNQEKLVDEAEEYQKERNSILADNKNLHNTVDNLELEYDNKKYELEENFKNKEFDIEYKYKSKIKSLENENKHLHKIIDKFYETIDKFIDWICKKFSIGESKELIKEFEYNTNSYIDPEKQIKLEEREKEWDLEL